MKTKRIVSMLMALAMVGSLSAPAFATAAGGPNVTDAAKMATGITTKISGKTTAGEISIVVPTTGTVVVNPYGLKIDTNGDSDSSGMENQIVSAWQAIENKSPTTDIDVSATVTGTAAGNVKLASGTDVPSYSADGTVKTNEIWAYLETETSATAKDATTALTAPSSPSFDEASGYTKNILITAKTSAATKVGKIAKVASGSESFLNFHINGVANKYTTTPWTAKDTLSVSVVFTFAPAVA